MLFPFAFYFSENTKTTLKEKKLLQRGVASSNTVCINLYFDV